MKKDESRKEIERPCKGFGNPHPCPRCRKPVPSSIYLLCKECEQEMA